MRCLFGFICVLVLLGIGCGNTEGSACSEAEIGRQSCDADDRSILLVCTEEGVWEDTGVFCGSGKHCLARDGKATCVNDDCDTQQEDFCFSLNSTDCDGTVLQECLGPAGCPVWTSVDCADSDLVCTVETRPASCVIPGACLDGATRCSSDRSEVETCQGGDWTVTTTCQQDQLCNDLGETAQCIDAACNEGETRCADNEVETCNAVGLWTVTETCVQGCEVVNDEARCMVDGASCTASNLFDQRCNPSNEIWIQECRNTGTEQAPVYEWVDSQNCSLQSPDYICVQEMGTFPYCFL